MNVSCRWFWLRRSIVYLVNRERFSHLTRVHSVSVPHSPQPSFKPGFPHTFVLQVMHVYFIRVGLLVNAQARDMPVAGIVAPDEALTSKPTRMKYTCITCKTNVWGKPGLKLGCGECGDAYRVNTR